MRGYEDGTFRPEGSITRAEFATLLVRLKGCDLPEASRFSDCAGHWASAYIGAADVNGLMSGYPDGSFKPDSFITRAEVMTAVNRMLGRVPDAAALAQIQNPYVDLSPEHWAYAQILEATVEHDAEYVDGVEVWS
jgi:hypothetical protein